MVQSNSKQRLFEVMGKVDSSFKPKLNEFYNPQSEGTELNQEEALNSYLETALWAEGGDGNELDGKTIYDVDDRAKQASLKDIQTFIQQAQQQAPEELANYDARTLGHNLWLSRNGHGAGFFDDNNDTLQNIARAMKGADIYVGDDGKVYIMGTESGGEQPMNEMPNWGKTRANPAYTHFAVIKTTGKIVNGWDYKGYDQDELRSDKRYYFLNDIKDNQIDPKAVVILTKKYLLAHGKDPYDYANWHKNDTDGTDIYTM